MWCYQIHQLHQIYHIHQSFGVVWCYQIHQKHQIYHIHQNHKSHQSIYVVSLQQQNEFTTNGHHTIDCIDVM